MVSGSLTVSNSTFVDTTDSTDYTMTTTTGTCTTASVSINGVAYDTTTTDSTYDFLEKEVERLYGKPTVELIDQKWEEMPDWAKIHFAQNHADLCKKTRYRFHALLDYGQRDDVPDLWTISGAHTHTISGTTTISSSGPISITSPTVSTHSQTTFIRPNWNTAWNVTSSGTTDTTTNVSPFTLSTDSSTNDSTWSLPTK